MPATAHAPEESAERSRYDRLARILLQVGLFVGTAVWTAFWLNVARLQWTLEGSALNVAFLLATVIVPPAILYVDYVLSVTDRTEYRYEVADHLPTPGGA